MILFIICVSIIGLIILAAISGSIIRKNKCSKWEIGDMLIIKPHQDVLKKNNIKFAELRGWDANQVYVSLGEEVYQISHSDVDYNKSSIWRENYNNCKSYMGSKQPIFNHIVTQQEFPKTEAKSGEQNPHAVINGIAIAAMNETECEVYLKLALKEEKFESAELIKQRMTKFR
jgi:hypothetical protein